jgi:hypothetical protein
MRWALLRDSIKRDWWKYSSTLTEGSIRWRAWFEQWRMAGRYTALREILLYHVGFEETHDPASETVTYSISETLLMDHHHSTSSSRSAASLTKKQKRRYQGKGALDTE